MTSRPKLLFVLAVLLALFVIVPVTFVTNIDPGHVGVRINKCAGGGVDDIPLGIGYHWQGPCTDIAKYPTYQQTMVLTKASTEGSTSDDSITVTSSEGLPISVDVSLSFTLEEGKVPRIYRKFRRDLEQCSPLTCARRCARRCSRCSRSTLRSSSIRQARDRAGRGARGPDPAPQPDGFNVTQFTINETRVPQAVTEAINSKVAMIQEAQSAEQEVRKTQAVASQKIAEADGEAKARRLRADAEAYSNERIGKSLTPALVEYMKLTKWDGKLPQITGAATPMIDLSSSK